MVAVNVAFMDGLRPFCSRILPKDRSAIQRGALEWIQRNRTAYLAAKLFRRDAPAGIESGINETADSALVLIKAEAQEDQESYCRVAFESTDLDIANETPRASSFVSRYIDNHPLPVAERDRFNFTMGCERQFANRAQQAGTEFDLDVAVSVCGCARDRFEQNTTAEERQEWDRLARAHKPESEMAATARIARAMSDCVTAPTQP